MRLKEDGALVGMQVNEARARQYGSDKVVGSRASTIGEARVY